MRSAAGDEDRGGGPYAGADDVEVGLVLDTGVLAERLTHVSGAGQ